MLNIIDNQQICLVFLVSSDHQRTPLVPQWVLLWVLHMCFLLSWTVFHFGHIDCNLSSWGCIFSSATGLKLLCESFLPGLPGEPRGVLSNTYMYARLNVLSSRLNCEPHWAGASCILHVCVPAPGSRSADWRGKLFSILWTNQSDDCYILKRTLFPNYVNINDTHTWFSDDIIWLCW